MPSFLLGTYMAPILEGRAVTDVVGGQGWETQPHQLNQEQSHHQLMMSSPPVKEFKSGTMEIMENQIDDRVWRSLLLLMGFSVLW